MMTDNQPADESVAQDETAQIPGKPGQPEAADVSSTESSSEAGAEPPSVEQTSPQSVVDPLPEAPNVEGSAPPQPDAGQRRLRLNPTIAPELARPIPSLRENQPPPTASLASVPPADAPDAADAPSEQSAAPAESASGAEQAAKNDPAADEVEVTAESAQEAAPPPPAAPPVELPSRNESLDADLEAELEAAMAGSNEQTDSSPPQLEAVETADGEGSAESAAALAPDAEIKRGAKLTGTVASIHGDDMFLDFGLRIPGVLSRRQFGLRKQPMQGEKLEVVVGRVDEKEGLLHVNLPTGTSRVRGQWDALSVDQNVECMVTGTNKGGLEVSLGALSGFIPASQVELGFVPDLNVYVGQKLKARIAEVNPKRRKLVLSRRALLEEERAQNQQELFEKIEPGQQYTGRVRTLKDYGAFVDIGGADGLLHVAQISWSRINHPSEVLQEGEEIQVQVLSVDKDKQKISLGMRQLTQNPWKVAESKFAQGAQVKGKVTRTENFGAFVELDEGVEGLVHISELDHKRVNKVTDVLRVGQEVEVQVLEVDPKRKRVSLSLKALKEKPEDLQEKAASEPIKRQRSVDSLVGGMGEPTGGQLFGDPNKFGR